MAVKPQSLDQDWMTVAETAKYCRCSTWTIRQRIIDGKLKVSQMVPNGRVLISAASIEKMLEKSAH